jgi:hypothetical protein
MRPFSRPVSAAKNSVPGDWVSAPTQFDTQSSEKNLLNSDGSLILKTNPSYRSDQPALVEM